MLVSRWTWSDGHWVDLKGLLSGGLVGTVDWCTWWSSQGTGLVGLGVYHMWKFKHKELTTKVPKIKNKLVICLP